MDIILQAVVKVPCDLFYTVYLEQMYSSEHDRFLSFIECIAMLLSAFAELCRGWTKYTMKVTVTFTLTMHAAKHV